MKRVIFQGALVILLFFGIWLALMQIDWMKAFNIQKLTDKTEQKLGELFWEVFQKTEKEHKSTQVIHPIDSIVAHICKANNIDKERLKIHVLQKDEINAFALPNGHLVIYTGLILQSDNPEELTGVICHEMAHIGLNHVMKKLAKEIGLSVLISMTTGNSGAEIIKETAKMLSSSAFDRNLEKEADLKAVDYLIKAKVNPEPFANLLYKLSLKENDATRYLTWINTHPDSKERAEYILEYSNPKQVTYAPILSDETWNKLKEGLEVED